MHGQVAIAMITCYLHRRYYYHVILDLTAIMRIRNHDGLHFISLCTRMDN